jgi:uncharacterized membrane protein
MQEVNDFFGKGTVQPNILQFKIMKDQGKQMKFVKQFNSEVYRIIGKAPHAMNVNPAPEYENVMSQYKNMMPEESKQYKDMVKEMEALKQELRAQVAKRSKAKCTNVFCITNHD